jgi:hypothetical protein
MAKTKHPDERIGGPVLSKSVRQERDKVIEALRVRGCSPEEIEALVGPEPPRVAVIKLAPLLKIPPFNSSEQTLDEWRVIADESWRVYREKLIDSWRAWPAAGEELPFDETPQRGPGRTGRNVNVGLRYRYAAARLCGESWEVIALICHADDYHRRPDSTVSRVKKAGNKVLDDADLSHRVPKP